MDSDSSSSSSPLPMHPITNSVETLMPIVDSLQSDLENIYEKLKTSTTSWLERPAVPMTDAMKKAWIHHELPQNASLHNLFRKMLSKARTLDLESRTIYFSERDADALSRESMTVFELLHLLIDSVQWV
jgi:hypothetical protein